MAEENQVELDLGTEEEEEVEVEAEAPKETEEVEVLEADSDDQFKKAEDATQKRILNELDKKKIYYSAIGRVTNARKKIKII